MQSTKFTIIDGHGPLYDAGLWAAEHWTDLSAFFSEPYTVGFIGGALILGCAAFLLVTRLSVRALRCGWDALHAPPGEIVPGNRREKPFDVIVDPPVRLRFEDRRKGGVQIIGPPGQGKTTLMLNMVLQDVAQGHTVVVIETDGDLSLRLLPYARALGLTDRFFCVDPGSGTTMKWNPLEGAPQKAVRQAVDTIASVSSGHDFYRDFNEDVVRHMTELVCNGAAYLGCQPTVGGLLNSVTDLRNLERVLEIGRDEAGRVCVRAPFVEGDLQVWLEQEFFSWSERIRREYLIGLRNLLRKLLFSSSAIEVLTPRESDTTLDVGKALNSGGVFSLRFPSEVLGRVGSQTLATWFLQRLQQETLGRRSPMRPVCCYLDEAHAILGKHNSPAADSFSSWFVQVRKYNVAPHVAYQSFSQLPDPLKGVLDSSARNKLISGGLCGDDARHAQELLGHARRSETEVQEISRESLFGPRRYQRVTRIREAPCYPVSEIEALPLTKWFFRGTSGGRQLPPTVLRVKKPQPPNALLARLWRSLKGFAR